MTETNTDDKVIGILSYLGILWVVAYIMYGNKKSEYNLFHVKQGLGLLISFVALLIAGSLFNAIGLHFVGWVLKIGHLALTVLSILGIISAANGEMKPVPVISSLTEKLLANFK